MGGEALDAPKVLRYWHAAQSPGIVIHILLVFDEGPRRAGAQDLGVVTDVAIGIMGVPGAGGVIVGDTLELESAIGELMAIRAQGHAGQITVGIVAEAPRSPTPLGAGQAIEAIVAKLAIPGGIEQVGDGGDVAELIVGITEIREPSVGQVGDPLALIERDVGELTIRMMDLGELTAGVVGDRIDVRRYLRRPAERIRPILDAPARGIGHRTQKIMLVVGKGKRIEDGAYAQVLTPEVVVLVVEIIDDAAAVRHPGHVAVGVIDRRQIRRRAGIIGMRLGGLSHRKCRPSPRSFPPDARSYCPLDRGRSSSPQSRDLRPRRGSNGCHSSTRGCSR